MWRKLVQSTYKRNEAVLQRSRLPYLPSSRDKTVLFIGALVQIWGGIERSLDEWVEDIHGRGGATLIQSMLPPSLDRELDYLSEALRLGLVPTADRERAGEIIQEIHRIKGFRHTLIHGSLVDIDDANLQVTVMLSRVRGDKRLRFIMTFKKAQMLRHYSRAYTLLRELTLFRTGVDIEDLEG